MRLFRINCTAGVGETSVEFLYSDEEKAEEHFDRLNISPVRNLAMRIYHVEDGQFVLHYYREGDK